ncbi:MAG TPA: Tox-REase-5 domain-containing protein [Myxococcaceae bacterium]|nr:Tox-REase-5 domain-containing protein [Myxococcaceae bacterium]
MVTKRPWLHRACWWVLALVLAGCRTTSGVPLGSLAELDAMEYHPATPQPGPRATRASPQAPPARSASSGGSGPRALVARAAQGAFLQVDAFEQVLLFAGLDNVHHLPPREAPLTPEDAAALYDVLLGKPVTLAGFGPRMVASYLLREAMEQEQELSREELLQRVQRFKYLAVLRPDGYLARALDGTTQQRVAPVQWKDGDFRARGFELGRFYSGRTGAFFPVDEHLQPLRSQPPLAEVFDDADLISRVLDGAEESFVELGLAIGHLVVHPIDSAAQLKQLPQNLATLLANSPQYLERFRLMTRGEQIEALSKLTTTLYSLGAAGVGATRTVATAGRGAEVLTVPALSLSAEGALVLERVAVPVGRAAAALSGGPGALVVLQRANTAARSGQPPPAQGPGQWGPAQESMSKRAARYQEQICGQPVSEAYWVGGVGRNSGGVKFDGFKDGVLLEAKGPGYANKFDDELGPKAWFVQSGAKQLLEQAERQLRAAPGVPIRWHVAEKKAADAIRKLLKGNRIEGIEVVHTGALQY